jgi:hypothetical protein
LAQPVRKWTFKGKLEMPAPIVIAIMFAIIIIVKCVDNRRALLATLGVIAAGTLFFAVSGAAGGDYGGLLGVGGFVGALVVGFFYARFKKRGSAKPGNINN